MLTFSTTFSTKAIDQDEVMATYLRQPTQISTLRCCA